MTPETCPNCGASVPPDASVCPDCGADEVTGWSEYAADQRLGLPDTDFQYEEFVSREFGGSAPKRRASQILWCLVALVLLLAFLILWVAR